ncbi:MAG: transposase [Actinobacteria bacterium]|nr:transposase [Actinomycetota bacterium]
MPEYCVPTGLRQTLRPDLSREINSRPGPCRHLPRDGLETRGGGSLGEREHRKKRLTPEQKWQIFLEASRKNTTDAEVCRRWGIAPHQLRVIRERAKDGAFDAFKKGPGRPKRDPEVVELEQELQRTNKALRELAIENTLLRSKTDGA